LTTTATRAPRLAASGITVRFGGVVALSDVSIEVPEASIVGLVGPNGAGKSTLFSVLSGLRRPDAGQVTMHGEEMTRATPQTRAARGLARTFQHPELFQGLTVRDHLVLAHRIKHAHKRILGDLFTFGGFRPSGREEDEQVDRLITELGLAAIANRPAIGLPLGLARLVEIGRALAREPSILLLDEASSGLDARETEDLVTVLRRVVEERAVSLLLVEHDVDLVLGISDQVVVLDFGVCIATGAPADIRVDPAVRAAYLGGEVNTSEEDE
jgi:branched-chain amino acid transport system ATP-binding protein